MKHLRMILVICLTAGPVLAGCKGYGQKRAHNEKTVETFLKLLEEENIPAFLELFSEDGKQLNPYASGLFPERVRGTEELRKYWEPVPGNFNGMKFTIKRFYKMLNPDQILVRFKGKIKLKPKGVYKNDYFALFEFDSDGKIKTYTEIFNPIEVVRAFGLKDKI